MRERMAEAENFEDKLKTALEKEQKKARELFYNFFLRILTSFCSLGVYFRRFCAAKREVISLREELLKNRHEQKAKNIHKTEHIATVDGDVDLLDVAGGSLAVAVPPEESDSTNGSTDSGEVSGSSEDSVEDPARDSMDTDPSPPAENDT